MTTVDSRFANLFHRNALDLSNNMRNASNRHGLITTFYHKALLPLLLFHRLGQLGGSV